MHWNSMLNVLYVLLLLCSRCVVNDNTSCYLNTVELGYTVMKGTKYFVSLWTSVVVTEECNVMVNSEELIATTEYVTL
jgi:hypothetical protein